MNRFNFATGMLKMKTLKHLARLVLALAAVCTVLSCGRSNAQEQFAGLCAVIKMQINQKLTLERIGFLATLTITDNDPTDPITDFGANLTFENTLLSTNGTVNDSSGKFFVQPPTLQGIQTVDGTGSIAPGQTVTISWFIIPATNAAGMNPNGIVYQVAASLSGKIRGKVIPEQTLHVYPAPITVKPDALLRITYFTPRDTIGDDPFTPQVESPIPFTFGVLVQNVGYGPAHNGVISSQQPKIVENKLNLLIVAQLLGSRVNDSALAQANLTATVGDLQPGQAVKGAWDMITSLSGTFLSVSANYTHSSALGGAETSLIQSVNAYLFLHEVLNDQPGRDTIKDFLADTSGAVDGIQNLIPDSLYESEGNILPVNQITNALVVGGGSSFQVTASPNFQGWGFMRLPDPGQAKLPIGSVVRSDGKVLNTNNFWTNIHFEPVTNVKHEYLNILDLVDIANYTYTVTYTNVAADVTPPITTLSFSGASTFTNGTYYITPQTQMYFLSQDASPVSIFYSLNGGSNLPAFPFSLTTPGTYQISYFAVDSSNNQETNHTATLVVPGPGSLGFASTSISGTPLFVAGDAASIRPAYAPISFSAGGDPTPVNAQVDIFQGVVGWAVLGNVPSSPTKLTTAAINVGGVNVDFYQYRLNNGAWSAEVPVATPLSLSGLPTGTNTLAVLGRSQYGSYLDATQAVVTSWVVDPAAPATVITGTPATPSRNYDALLSVGGTGVTNYSWTINKGFYRAPTSSANPIILSNLNTGAQVVGVLGKVGGVTQSTNNPTTVSWTINPLYGFDQAGLKGVRTVAYTNIGNVTKTFNWDGRDGSGVVQSPGLYTVRVTLTDALGYTNFTVGLAQISALAGTNVLLADTSRGPANPHGRGRWAVWQDQSNGHNEIYAQDLYASNSMILKVSNSTFSQENPKTDGRYVVWQGRQANASWDVYVADLEGSNGPVALSTTAVQDEIAPTIEWPWVVFQSRPTGSAAPWQLYATNLLDGRHFAVSPSAADEVTPDLQGRRVVWQDFRDVGPGEVYLANLEQQTVRRISTNLFGQYHPVIYGNWIVWQDNRNSQSDLYGFDLLRNAEVRVTSTPEDELQPYIDGDWVVCTENSLGAGSANARLVHLPSLVTVPVTRTAANKTVPVLAGGLAIWQESPANNQNKITGVGLPALQGVFQNRNLVTVTPDMVSYAHNAYGLLAAWSTSGVQEITTFTSLTPQVTQTAMLANGTPAGVNFNLVAGTFLWVKFNGKQVLDLGVSNNGPLNLVAGANVFGYTQFPSGYDAYQLLRQIGLNNAIAVRMLDSQSGRWRVAEVQGGAIVGDNFAIPNVAVLMLSLTNPVNQFTPEAQ